MSGGVAETGTVPAVSYLDTWFQRLPRDERFSEVAYTQFNSIVSLEAGTQLIFCLNATDPPYCYDVSDALISATVRITKEDGTLPDPSALVYPVNSSLLSAFDSLDLRVNDVSITQSPGYYGYRSYMQNLISYDESAKQTNLFLSGWLTDNCNIENGIGNIDPTEENEGMLARNAWFRENYSQNPETPYSVSGCTLISPLKHEIYGNRVLFPPSTKIMFTFTKAPSAWYLMVPPTKNDKEKYKFHLSNCVLFVKLVTLNDHLYRSLVTRMEKEPISFHYRRLAIKTEVLNSHSIYFESNNLFSDSTAPLRVYFALVKNKSLGNSYECNPYSFIRSLKVEHTANKKTFFNPYNAFQSEQLEILKQQQEQNQKIFQEISKYFVKEKKRKQKKKEKRLEKKQRIGQLDGNESEQDPTNKPSSNAKGKSLPKRNASKGKKNQSQPPNNLGQAGTSKDNVEATAETKSNEIEQRQASKLAQERLAVISKEGDEPDNSESDYEASFIDDDTSDDMISSSDDSDTYQTAPSVDRKATTSAKASRELKPPSPKRPTTPPFLPTFMELQGSDADICYVESFTLDVNSKPLDQLHIPATKNCCVTDYLRFLATTGYFQNIHSADVTYDMFKCGFGIFAFDLSVSKTTTDPYAVPLATGGYLRVRIKFNQPPQEPLMLLIMSETSETMTIDRQGRIQLSYKDPIVKN